MNETGEVPISKSAITRVKEKIQDLRKTNREFKRQAKEMRDENRLSQRLKNETEIAQTKGKIVLQEANILPKTIRPLYKEAQIRSDSIRAHTNLSAEEFKMLVEQKRPQGINTYGLREIGSMEKAKMSFWVDIDGVRFRTSASMSDGGFFTETIARNFRTLHQKYLDDTAKGDMDFLSWQEKQGLRNYDMVDGLYSLSIPLNQIIASNQAQPAA